MSIGIFILGLVALLAVSGMLLASTTLPTMVTLARAWYRLTTLGVPQEKRARKIDFAESYIFEFINNSTSKEKKATTLAWIVISGAHDDVLTWLEDNTLLRTPKATLKALATVISIACALIGGSTVVYFSFDVTYSITLGTIYYIARLVTATMLIDSKHDGNYILTFGFTFAVFCARTIVLHSLLMSTRHSETEIDVQGSK